MKTNGSVACWGLNLDGESTPPGGEFASVSAGDFAYVRGEDGRLRRLLGFK